MILKTYPEGAEPEHQAYQCLRTDIQERPGLKAGESDAKDTHGTMPSLNKITECKSRTSLKTVSKKKENANA